jgi:hypothetical protein
MWHGILTSEDMRQQLLRLASDPDWPPGPSHLIDGTTLETVVIPDPELIALLYEGHNRVKKTRLALVVSPEFFETERLAYQAASDVFDAATFTDLERACTFLDLTPGLIRPLLDELRDQLADSRS